MGGLTLFPTMITDPTNFESVMGMTAFEASFVFGVVFVGIVLWSLCNDPVPRIGGAVCVIGGGLVLLGVAIQQGIGDAWMGTVPFSAIFMGVGIYLMVRVFIDQFTGGAET